MFGPRHPSVGDAAAVRDVHVHQVPKAVVSVASWCRLAHGKAGGLVVRSGPSGLSLPYSGSFSGGYPCVTCNAVQVGPGATALTPVPELTDEGLDRTIKKWRSWSDDFNYDGPWADAVQRSALDGFDPHLTPAQ